MVAVKRFPKNTYFLEMLISGKGKYFHVFGCISKNFPENIFWCLEKKKENTNPEKHKPQPRKNSNTVQILPLGSLASRDRDQRLDLAVARSRSTARSREGEIAIDGSSSRISRSSSTDLPLGSLVGAISRRRDRVRRFSSRARTRSLSLSFFGNALKGKQKCKSISVVKGIFFGSTDFNFRKIEFSEPTKQPHFQKSISISDFHPKQTQPQL